MARLSYFARLLGGVETRGPVIAPAHPLLDRWRAVSAPERLGEPPVAGTPGKQSARPPGVPENQGEVEGSPVVASTKAPTLRRVARRTAAAPPKPPVLTPNDPPLAAATGESIGAQFKTEARPRPVAREAATAIAEPGPRPAKTIAAPQRARDPTPDVASLTPTLQPSRAPPPAQTPRGPERRALDEAAAELPLAPARQIAPRRKERAFAPPPGAPIAEVGAQKSPQGVTPSPLPDARKQHATEPILLEPRAAPQPQSPRVETAVAKTAGVHIGAIDIHIQPPAPVQPAPRPAPAPPSAPLARGFSSPFGIRQG